MRQAIPCPHCGTLIERHWEVFTHEPTCDVQAEFAAKHQRLQGQIADRPGDVSPWTLEKATNRLHRKLEQVAHGMLRPRAAYTLTGEAQRAYQEAQAVVHESMAAIEEARRQA
jgi:hypothetical protein